MGAYQLLLILHVLSALALAASLAGSLVVLSGARGSAEPERWLARQVGPIIRLHRIAGVLVLVSALGLIHVAGIDWGAHWISASFAAWFAYMAIADVMANAPARRRLRSERGLSPADPMRVLPYGIVQGTLLVAFTWLMIAKPGG